MKQLFSVRNMAFTAIMSALICIAAPFSVPTPSAVPLSIATFVIYLTGALLGKNRAALAVVIYLLIGFVGLPVFTGFTGGFARLAGVTGGFLIGYIPCAYLTGVFADTFGDRIWAVAAGAALGTLSLYLIGTAWFMLITDADIITALAGCVLPFLPFDIVKIAAAAAISIPLRKKLRHLLTEK